MAVALVCLMAGGYLIARRKMRFREAASLPFYKIELSQVNDGMYEGKTYTSFLHLQLKVTVEDHNIKSIDVLENEGIDGETARPIIQKMIEQNSIVVPAIKGAELGSLVYIIRGKQVMIDSDLAMLYQVETNRRYLSEDG